MSKYIRKYNGIYVDGNSKVGDCTDYTAPVPEVTTEEFRAGGMDAPILQDMGMAAMTASFVTGEDPDILKLFGITKNGSPIAIYVRGALVDEETGDVIATVDEIRGKITKVDKGTFSPGGVNLTTYEMSVTYYRYEQDGDDIIEIDPKNSIRKIGGVDAMEAVRTALGI